MLGRTPGNIVAIRPLKDGVIADFDVTEKMLHYFISKVHRRRTLVRPRIVVGVPSGITQVEKRAVRDSRDAGGRPRGVPDRGADGRGHRSRPADPGAGRQHDRGHRRRHHRGGRHLAGRASSTAKSVRIAGDEMDEAIVQYIKKHYNLLIGERRAEEIKIALGSAVPDGRRAANDGGQGARPDRRHSRRPSSITDEEIREALREPVDDHRGDGPRRAWSGRRRSWPRTSSTRASC